MNSRIGLASDLQRAVLVRGDGVGELGDELRG